MTTRRRCHDTDPKAGRCEREPHDPAVTLHSAKGVTWGYRDVPVPEWRRLAQFSRDLTGRLA